MPNWESIEGSLATPRGFRAAAVAAGIKKIEGALDLALIVSDAPQTAAAGTFTTNRACAAPVHLCREHLASSGGRARAVVVNSGNANCATGRAGRRTALGTALATAHLLGLAPRQVLVCSTGVIGVPLKLELILGQLPTLKDNLSVASAAAAARAIMTTDTLPKTSTLRTEIAGTPVHLAGIAKGAGMIHPHMATMLAFITTDAIVAPRHFREMLRAAVEVSFNRVTVDGDTSTNDSVIALASGLSGAVVRPGTKASAHFLAGLTELCQQLAQMMARDGEGAKKLVTVVVSGARSASDAERAARAVANSLLVKTAIAGNDPNWGRIWCAVGYSGARFDPARLDIRVNQLYVCRRGIDTGFDETQVRRELDQKELTLRIDLHQGKASARMWTCDLTQDYISVNASYRT